jgi:hypothetical protein
MEIDADELVEIRDRPSAKSVSSLPLSECLVHCVEESGYQAAVVIFLSIKAGLPINVGTRFGAENGF